jgi:malonate transporter
MIDVINLALPFFGLIFLGLACGKYKQIPDTGLAWMNFFIIYVALPALFYRILAKTPFDELNNIPFVVGTTLSTFLAFVISLALTLAAGRGKLADAAISGIAGAYGNVGYMGPGLAIATLGTTAAGPVALVFCFDSLLAFSLVPMLMALAGAEKRGLAATAFEVARRIALHPFIVATVLGVVSAAVRLEPPLAVDRLLQFLQNAAAPCALFVLGVTVALRPLGHLAWQVPAAVTIKLVVHPAIVFIVLSLMGGFTEIWIGTAVLMAALPPALNVFIMARQYDTWVEEASASVLFGTMVSVLTLTTVMWLVKTQSLPHGLFR